jgi:hypothetical protein
MTSLLVSHVQAETVGTGPDGQFEGGKVRIRMRPGMDRTAAQRDLAMLGLALRPSDKSAVAPLVAVLKARTKSKHSDPQEAAFEAQVLMADLCQYPIDVVQYACDYWVAGGDDGKWMPAWSELRELCERRMQPRRALARALQWVADGEPQNAL